MKAIVVGAGAAGLYGGYLLKAQGAEVQVLEARPEPGGRIRTDFGFAPFPVEHGAAYVHGHNHVFHQLAEHAGVPILPDPIGDYYGWKGKILSRKEARKHRLLRAAIGFFGPMHRYQGPERPLRELWEEGKWEKIAPVLDGLAFEYGCDFSDMGAAALAEDEMAWAAEGGDYVLPQGIFPIFREMVEDLGSDLRCNMPVSGISYGVQGAQVETADGTLHHADAVLVTVPLGVLKSRLIRFEPPLPEAKQEAIERLGIGPGMKVFLQFGHRFWKKKMHSLLGGALCPLYEIVPAGAGHEQPVLKAYVMGHRARALAKLGEGAIGALLGELDALFGENAASKAFLKGKIVDWAAEPHIWGAYSFAAPHSAGMRLQLALPVGDRLYFAGEATHFKGFPATVQGAMDSAAGAVEALIYDHQHRTKSL